MCLLVHCASILVSSLASEMTRCRCILCSNLNTRSHLCHHPCTVTGRDERFDTSLLSLGPSGFLFSFLTFFGPRALAEHIRSAATHSHTYLYTQMPRSLSGPEGYTERYVLGSCSLISSSHTHSGSAITSGGPVRHECYPVDNNHSGGKEQSQSHIC